jgi:hypothetical protein
MARPFFLAFFACRLRVENGPGGRTVKTPAVYLRFTAQNEGHPRVEFLEGVLSQFCFPLGPELVVPKEVLAAEVRAAGQGALPARRGALAALRIGGHPAR